MLYALRKKFDTAFPIRQSRKQILCWYCIHISKIFPNWQYIKTIGMFLSQW